MIALRRTSLLLVWLIAGHAVAQTPHDVVHGNLIQFSENGAWCWYQDERALVDTERGVILLGAEASGEGVDGPGRDGNVDTIQFDMATGSRTRRTLRVSGSDDHNVPAFLKLPDGDYLTMYADHYDLFSRYRIFDGEYWSAERQFEWNLPGRRTYSNLFYLSEEATVYNISRADRENPHIMISRDAGETWTYLGLLTEPLKYIGYVNGYFKYWSNGRDRIDFVATEYHPRDYNTSLYHGYIQGGKTYNSFDEVVDESIADTLAPLVTDFTPVFLAGTVVNGQPMTRIWNHDLVRYDDGTVAALLKARTSDLDPDHPSNNPDHAVFYARFDGQKWTTTYLGRAGKKLYSSEQDYTGLGALDPNDASTIYISTPFDPRIDTDLGVHEIFRGVTTDNGATWTWTPVTEHSTRDNLRPIVPAWDDDHTALLWFRGSYFSAQSTDAAIVGIIQTRNESPVERTFLDATPLNTTRADGSAFDPTGPSPDRGGADDNWHIRSGYGNGGSLLASSEIAGENAPVLRTEFPTGLETGVYDVWIDFWGKPTADWRIRAGIRADRMMVFRHMASQMVDADTYSTDLRTNQEDLRLYAAYLGRINISAPGQVHYVYVDDDAVEAGSTDRVGDRARTWYDGIGYARSGPASNTPDPSAPYALKLGQNFPNPFRTSTRIQYDVPVESRVRLEIFDVAGRRVRTLQDGLLPAGTYVDAFTGDGLPSGVYFYRLAVGERNDVRSMILVH